jgi:FAD:protein FMN transferase
MAAVAPTNEAIESFHCFGTTCAVLVSGYGPAGGPQDAAAAARRRLECWHQQFSRFDPASELSLLNADPRPTVPVSPMMARLAEAVVAAAEHTGGLVDATLVDAIEQAGYATNLDSPPVPLSEALALAPPRRPGGADPAGRWRQLRVDRGAGTVSRPPGLRLDSGGIAKGLFADALAPALAGHPSFAIDCGGDIRFGGRGRLARELRVASPFDGSTIHAFELAQGAVATSGIGKRSWRGEAGRPAHHLLDPATGAPAFTGIVQVTALAASALSAEALSKAALLAGPATAEQWLPYGGVIVLEDGSHRVIDESCPATGAAHS